MFSGFPSTAALMTQKSSSKWKSRLRHLFNLYENNICFREIKKKTKKKNNSLPQFADL